VLSSHCATQPVCCCLLLLLQDIVIGRHRDMEDRISWCLAVGRYEAALSLAEADRTTTDELWGTVVQVRVLVSCCGLHGWKRGDIYQ
jgi:hypothetical protein